MKANYQQPLVMPIQKLSSISKLEKLWAEHGVLTDSRQLLWIKGSLGSGKSFLMEEALRRHTAEGQLTAAFFFDKKEDLLHSASGMFRSLLYQLLPHCRNSVLDKIFENKHRIAKSHGTEIDWRLEELQMLLKTAVTKELFCNIVLIIDGVDQCRKEDRDIILGCLEDLSGEANQFNSKLHVWVSSRYEIVRVPKGCLSIHLESMNQEDISDYVDEKLSIHPQAGLDQFRSFKTAIKKKSKGNFAWLVVVIEVLRRKINDGQDNVRFLETHMDCLPDTMHNLYHAMLIDVQEDRQPRLKFFQWAVLNDDLTLETWHHILPLLDQSTPRSFETCKKSSFWAQDDAGVERLISYLSLGLFRASSSSNVLTSPLRNEEDDSVLGIAGSMDSRLGNTRKVRPVHESVINFFVKGSGFDAFMVSGHRLSPTDGYVTILHTCLDFISLKDFDRLVQRRQLAYSADQTRSSASSSEKDSQGRSRSRSVASFSSAISAYSGHKRSVSLYSGKRRAPSRVNSTSSISLNLSPISRKDLISISSDKSPVSQTEMSRFRLEHLLALKTDAHVGSHLSSPCISTNTDASEHSLGLQSLGTEFLTHVISRFLGYCQSLDASGHCPESIIYRLQNGSLWERFQYLREIDPSELTIAEWAESERLQKWVDYLSTTESSAYMIIARDHKSRSSSSRPYGSICLRYCFDLGDRFISRSDNILHSASVGNPIHTEEPFQTGYSLEMARAQLHEAMASVQDTIPLPTLRHILTPVLIQNIGKAWGALPYDIATIFHSHLRIFAILIWMERPERIQDFLSRKVSDEHLPLSIFEDEDSRDLSCSFIRSDRFGNLPVTPRDLFSMSMQWRVFEKCQWSFLSPFLFREGDDIYHYKLSSSNLKLPIVRQEDWNPCYEDIIKVQFSPGSTNFGTKHVSGMISEVLPHFKSH